MIYRTWGFGEFSYDEAEYVRISSEIEPHENLFFAVKHVAGDFHRTVEFNQILNSGIHKQIVEVQAAREYEGKGAYPNYIGDGVINGFEEYEWLMDSSKKQSLRDVINTKNSKVVGIWTWSRGGGWNGPYINGVNGKKGVHEGDNNEVVIEKGSELWNDLNAYVVTKWAKNTSNTDKYFVTKYATEILGMNEKDAKDFYRFCLLSARAVLLGRARGTEEYNVNTWWTRDQNIDPSLMINDIKTAINNGKIDRMLQEKMECVQIWKEMIEIAENLDDSVKMKDYLITTTKYGYYLFSLIEKIFVANALRVQGDRDGEYSPRLKQTIDEYDSLWLEWENLFKMAVGCPSLYAKEDKELDLIGYKGNKGLDSAINYLRLGQEVEGDSKCQITS